MAHLHVVGTGLIGASFALAARAAGCFERISGYDQDPARSAQAQAVGALDEISPRPSPAASSDGILIAVPVGRVAGTVAELVAGGLAETTTLFDVGSAKQSSIDALRDSRGGLPAQFVPGHPMAGSERSGPGAAAADLFRDRRVFLTPEPETDRGHLGRVRGWWQACGARVVETTAVRHDQAVALTSHLPHLLASAFMVLVGSDRDSGILEFAGSGFEDFTRIAGGDAGLWRDIIGSNSDAIEAHLTGLLAILNEARDQLADDRLAELQSMLERGQRQQRLFDAGADR